jgi:hypothetical protein
VSGAGPSSELGTAAARPEAHRRASLHGAQPLALMPGQLYDALRAGNVPDDKARAAAEEVANYEGELTKLRLEIGERFRETGERIGRVESDLRLLKWMVGFLTAVQLGTLTLVWQILLRLPSP